MNNLRDIFEKRILHAIKAANFVVGRKFNRKKNLAERFPESNMTNKAYH